MVASDPGAPCSKATAVAAASFFLFALLSLLSLHFSPVGDTTGGGGPGFGDSSSPLPPVPPPDNLITDGVDVLKICILPPNAKSKKYFKSTLRAREKNTSAQHAVSRIQRSDCWTPGEICQSPPITDNEVVSIDVGLLYSNVIHYRTPGNGRFLTAGILWINYLGMRADRRNEGNELRGTNLVTL
ncbi:PREDICTED: uncharacterized protein LOC106788990 [Polistes canadensis]|uniref:uncharacterized protein LOC106788990 n=1 Tax=Polistes canadensis TaxID=91411 RepID=UPI000718C77A|nr:PREDICTED: uncharacterized protein LOC106788990 [Polistes canadensis]